jgi:CheY-like chemotaxis protein
MLVVDDNAENREVLLQLLGGLGCEVAAAADGAAGVECWRSFQPDLTWMDLRMPVMDGFAACRAITDLAKEANAPAPRIVAITASSLETVRSGSGRAQMEAAGFSAWVGKPFRESEIHAILQRHLGMAPPPPPAGPGEGPAAAAATVAAGAGPGAAADDLAERAAALAPAQRDALAAAATRADFDACQAEIAALAATEPALAARLAVLLDQYRFDLIRDLVAPGEASPGTAP